MKIMFAVRLRKSEKNVEGKCPVVLQTTFDRKVRRKRTGVWVSEDQFYIDQDKKGRIKNVGGIDEKSMKIQNYFKWARRVLEDEFEDIPFDYKEFAKELEKKVNPKKEQLYPKQSKFLNLLKWFQMISLQKYKRDLVQIIDTYQTSF